MALAGWCGYRQALSSPVPAASPESQRSLSIQSQQPAVAPVKTSPPEDRDFIPLALAHSGDTHDQWTVISGYSEARVKAALETVAKTPDAPGAQMLVSQLYYRWGQLNPPAAVASEERRGFNSLRSTLPAGHPDRPSPATLAWLKQEPHTAEAAAAEIQQKTRSQEANARAAPLPQVLHPRKPEPPPPAPKPDPAIDPFSLDSDPGLQ
ncbi:hypothetical protein [Luteolibacter sp. LG18]|uniref:hypothetical protein n=1 Tax=Luteolibacter sp. LG18 TaxID=2819286 RepID=UPI0030C6B103